MLASVSSPGSVHLTDSGSSHLSRNPSLGVYDGTTCAPLDNFFLSADGLYIPHSQDGSLTHGFAKRRGSLSSAASTNSGSFEELQSQHIGDAGVGTHANMLFDESFIGKGGSLADSQVEPPPMDLGQYALDSLRDIRTSREVEETGLVVEGDDEQHAGSASTTPLPHKGYVERFKTTVTEMARRNAAEADLRGSARTPEDDAAQLLERHASESTWCITDEYEQSTKLPAKLKRCRSAVAVPVEGLGGLVTQRPSRDMHSISLSRLAPQLEGLRLSSVLVQVDEDAILEKRPGDVRGRVSVRRLTQSEDLDDDDDDERSSESEDDDSAHEAGTQ